MNANTSSRALPCKRLGALLIVLMAMPMATELLAQPRVLTAISDAADTTSMTLNAAAEQPTDVASDTSSNAQKKETTKATDQREKDASAKNNNKRPNDDRGFIPSEEISEDFAISFPVDI